MYFTYGLYNVNIQSQSNGIIIYSSATIIMYFIIQGVVSKELSSQSNGIIIAMVQLYTVFSSTAWCFEICVSSRLVLKSQLNIRH